MPSLNSIIPVLYTALDQVSRELTGFVPAVSRDSDAAGAAKGQTIRSHIAPAITTEDITPGHNPANSGDHDVDYVDMTIDKAKAAPVRWTGENQRGVAHSGQLDRVMSDQFAQSMRALINEVERDVAAEYVRASRAYGTAGTTPFGSDLTAAAEVKKILDDNGAPMGDRGLVIDTSAGVNLRSDDRLIKASYAGTDDTLRRGVLRDLYGMDLRESAGIRTHSGGTLGADASLDGSHSAGATELTLSDAGSIDLKAGDVLTIGDYKYVVAEDVDSGDKVKIREPGLMVDESGTDVSVASDFTANMAFHRSALHLVTRAPAMPQGGDSAGDVTVVQDENTGLAFQVALYREYRRVKYEVGLAWGARCVKPEHAAILLG